MAKIIIQSSEDKLNGIHYEVDTNQQPLGVGGMGQVFKGTRIDSRTGVARDVAIKFLLTTCRQEQSNAPNAKHLYE